MNAEERQVIDDIFRRLEQVANQTRDPEAERYIADKVRQQPYATYALAQSAFVQEQAIANLSAELERLRAENEELRRQPAGGGFLSGLFGGGRQPEPSRAGPGSPWGRPAPQGYPQQQGYQPGYPQGAPFQGGPMGGAMAGGPWGGAQPRAGGGFLQGALATAAGVAGGMMIANALTSAFSGEHGVQGAANALAGFEPAGNDAAGGDLGSISDGLYQDASHQEPDQDFSDFGGDGGDGGDWA